MGSEDVQGLCDWCHGGLSDRARLRSRWLGLAGEDTWACTQCLRAGRYRVPPDGWLGPSEGWLARDEYVLDDGDRDAIVNALNEVLHGPGAVDEWEFKTRIGVSRERALRTLRSISADGA